MLFRDLTPRALLLSLLLLLAVRGEYPNCKVVNTAKALEGEIASSFDKSVLGDLHVRSLNPARQSNRALHRRKLDVGHFYLQIDRIKGKDYARYYMNYGDFEDFFSKSPKIFLEDLTFAEFELFFGPIYRFLTILLTWDQFQIYYSKASQYNERVPIIEMSSTVDCSYSGPSFYLGEEYHGKIPFLATPDHMEFFFAQYSDTMGPITILLDAGELQIYLDTKASYYQSKFEAQKNVSAPSPSPPPSNQGNQGIPENQADQQNQENKKTQGNEENPTDQGDQENPENQDNQDNQDNQQNQDNQENRENQDNQTNQPSQRNHENPGTPVYGGFPTGPRKKRKSSAHRMQ